jgi:glycosyltransferase involved in cell wall biosynthesis
LSICIPTYQRSEKLAVLLSSIVCQDDPRVEVVVSDNGSTDGTAEMVQEFTFLRPLKWHQWNENVGFDRNLLKVVSMASGEYCWLVGSDDALTPGAVSHILDLIDTYRPSGILASAIICDADLVPIPETPAIKPVPFEKIPFDEIIPRIGIYLGFFSLQIVQRDLWVEAASDDGWRNTAKNWSQYYMMLKIAANLAVNGWLRDPTQVILYRSSSFADQIVAVGSVHTKIIRDLAASMEAITATVPPHLLDAFLSDLMQFEIRRDIFFWKNSRPSWRQKAEMLSLGGRILGRYYWWWFKLVPIIVMPNVVLNALRFAIRKGKAILRSISPKPRHA